MKLKTKYHYIVDITNIQINCVTVYESITGKVLMQITNRFLFESLKDQGFLGGCNPSQCYIFITSTEVGLFRSKVAEFYS
jgi:hypothetical protein